MELSHHSLVQYRLPSTGELVPLLHIAPSKADVERLLVISPELADVLAAIITRVRNSADTVPLVVAYDIHEREFTPPTPVLFQHHVGAASRPSSSPTTSAITRTPPSINRPYGGRRHPDCRQGAHVAATANTSRSSAAIGFMTRPHTLLPLCRSALCAVLPFSGHAVPPSCPDPSLPKHRVSRRHQLPPHPPRQVG